MDANVTTYTAFTGSESITYTILFLAPELLLGALRDVKIIRNLHTQHTCS